MSLHNQHYMLCISFGNQASLKMLNTTIKQVLHSVHPTTANNSFPRGGTKDQVEFWNKADISSSIIAFQPRMDIASCRDLGATMEDKDEVWY